MVIIKCVKLINDKKDLIIGLGGAGNNVLNELLDSGIKTYLLISPEKENIKNSSVQIKFIIK